MGSDESVSKPDRRHGKGKGKAHEENVAPVEAQSTTESAISRIASSATNLASNMISNSIKPDVTSPILPANKGGPSNTALRPSLGEPSNYRPQAIKGAASGNFKSPHVQAHVAREEASFLTFLEGISVSEAPRSYPAELNLDTFGVPSPLQANESPDTEDYSQTDGMEVVGLLDSGYEEVAQPEPEAPLTIEEASALRRALFQGDVGSTGTESHDPDWNSILNFFPDYLSNGNSSWGYNEISQHLGVMNPSEARDIWAQQWQDVLSSYTDEVWGDLSSLVQRAREEIQEVRSDGSRVATSSELKAVYRLRQILAHIRAG